MEAAGLSVNLVGDSSSFDRAVANMQSSASETATHVTQSFAQMANNVNASISSLASSISEGSKFAIRSISELENEIREFQKIINQSTNVAEIESYNNEIKRLETQLRNLKVVGGLEANAKGADAFGKAIKANTDKAAQSLTDLGRIVQDLPFGSGAIANNFNPFIEGLGRLSKQAKETGVSVSSLLVAALKGPGGLGIAVSFVSAAMSFASVGLSAWTRGFGGATKAAKDNTKAIDENAAAIKRATDAAAADLAQVSKLVAAADLSTTSVKQREEILKQLKNQNETYFGSLKIEKGQIDGLSDAYEKYAENIFRVAKAKAASATIEDLGKKLVPVTQKISELTDQLSATGKGLTFGDIQKNGLKSVDEITKAYATLGETAKKDFLSLDELKKISNLTGLSEKQVNDILARRQQYRTQEKQLIAQIADLSKFVAQNDTKGLLTNSNDKEKIDKIAEVLRKLQADRLALAGDPLIPDTEKPLKDIQLIEDAIRALFNLKVPPDAEIIRKLIGMEDFDKLFKVEIPEALKKAQPKDIGIPAKLEIDEKKFVTNLRDIQKQADAVAKRHQLKGLGLPVHTMQGMATTVDLLNDDEVFKNFDEKMKDTGQLVNDFLITPFENLFTTLLNGGDAFASLQQYFTQLITKLIATAIAAAAVAALFSAIGFPIAGAANANFSSIFSAISGIPKFANGGIVSGPTMAMVGEYAGASGNPEVIAPLNKLKDLLPGGGGGNIAVNLNGEFVLDGQILRLAVQRADKQYNR